MICPELFPRGPEWTVDFEGWERLFPALSALKGCVGDPVHHQEGDVEVHTRMVLEAMASLPAYRGLHEDERRVVTMACLFHDVAKPATVQLVEDGRVRHVGHARRGTRMARRMLWEAGVPFSEREQVCGLIRHHEVPLFAIERDAPMEVVVRASMTARCDLLSVVAHADALGRKCEDKARLLDNVALFRELCEEAECLDTPYPFLDDHTRVAYFQLGHRPANVRRFDDTVCEVVVMSGLPGAGKSTWIGQRMRGAEVVSLDAIRRELGVLPSGDQSRVVEKARETARGLLRAGRGYVWNATNVSRELREVAVGLALRYGARVRVVYVEAPCTRLREQNRGREAVVPDAVMERLMSRWDVPDPTEAHVVELAVGE